MNNREGSISRDTIINAAGGVIPVLVSFLVVPHYLQRIGDARYGVLTIVWVLLGYFGFFDFGLGRAVANRVAQLADAPHHRTEAVFWTALIINGFLGAMGGLVLYTTGGILLGNIFKIDEALRAEALAALPILSVAVPLATISTVLSNTLDGKRLFLVSNVLGSVTNVLFQVAPLSVVLVRGPALTGLVGAIVAVRLISLLLYSVVCRQLVGIGLRPQFDLSVGRLLLGYGSWITADSIIAPILSNFDRLIISGVIGVQKLIYYTIPHTLISQLSILPASLSRSLFPRFSAMEDLAAAKTSQRAATAIAGLMTPLIVMGMMLSEPFLYVWLGPEPAAQAGPIAAILLLGFWFNSLAFIPYVQLQGQGRPDLVAKIHFVEVPIYLVVLWIGLITLGLEGAAWAWTSRVILDVILLFAAVRAPLRWMVTLAPPALLTVLATVGALTRFDQSLAHLLFSGTLVFVATAWSLFTQWATLLQLLRGVQRQRNALRAHGE